MDKPTCRLDQVKRVAKQSPCFSVKQRVLTTTHMLCIKAYAPK